MTPTRRYLTTISICLSLFFSLFPPLSLSLSFSLSLFLWEYGNLYLDKERERERLERDIGVSYSVPLISFVISLSLSHALHSLTHHPFLVLLFSLSLYFIFHISFSPSIFCHLSLFLSRSLSIFYLYLDKETD